MPVPPKNKYKDRPFPPVVRSNCEVEAWQRELDQLTGTKPDFGKNESASITKELSKAPDPRKLQLSYTTTDLVRRCPFHPMNKRQMSERCTVEVSVVENNFGKVVTTSGRLSVYDESVLLGLLSMIRKQRSNKIETTIYEVGKIIGSRPGGNTYKAIRSSIRLLKQATIRLQTTAGQEEGFNIINWYYIDEATGKLLVEIAPHFLAKLDLGLITSIDLKFRSQIRGDIGKALHRVLESQRDFYKKGRWSVSLLELCQQINIAKAPIFEIRRMIRLAMAELIRLHYLKQGSNLVTKADRVTFIRR